MISCPGCGANLRYDIDSGNMLCSYCGNSYNPYLFDEKAKDAGKQEWFEGYVYTCPGCGAELVTADQTDVTAFCSYCGSADFIFDRFEDRKRPDGILPFTLTKEQCIENYLRVAKKAVFTSSRYKSREAVESFRGIYMPYWSYSVSQSEVFDLKGSTSVTSGDTVTVTSYDVTGSAKGKYKGIAHDASRAFDDSISECLAPFPTREAKPFTPGYLSGFYADAADTDPEFYDDAVLHFAQNFGRKTLGERLDRRGAPVENLAKAELPAEITEVSSVMFPVWFMSVRSGNRVSYATVNGRTGKVVADFPISPLRLFGCAAALTGLLFLILNFLVMPTPAVTLIITALILIFSCILNLRENKSMRSRDSLLRKRRPDKERLDWVSSERFRKTDKKEISDGRIILAILFGVFFVFPSFAAFAASLEDSDPVFTVVASLLLLGNLWVFLRLFGMRKPGKTKGIRRGPGFRGVLNAVVTGALLLAAVIVLITEPLNKYYYLCCLALISFAALMFVQALLYHQILSGHRPPQFNKKGGEDDAE